VKKFSAYTGFVSRKSSSGQKDTKGLPITKAGNHILKRHLALAADVAMRQDPELAAFAIRLLSAGKHYNQVRVAVGRKVGVRAYSLLKRHANGQLAVYQWRDLDGNTISQQEAKALAATLWAQYKQLKQALKEGVEVRQNRSFVAASRLHNAATSPTSTDIIYTDKVQQQSTPNTFQHQETG